MFEPKDLAFSVRAASSVSDLREPAFRIIDRMQDLDPSTQVRALALAFTVVASEIGIPAFDLVQMSERMMSQAEGPHTIYVQAIRDYARTELLRLG